MYFDKTKKIKAKCKRIFSQYKKNEAGNFSLVAAVSILTLLATTALAVDISNAQSAKSRLQDATDAIALFAVKDNLRTQSQLKRAADNYLENNIVDTRFLDASIDNITRNGDVVTVKASDKVETFFAQILGKESVRVSVESQAVQENRGLDLALVLDSTGSMNGPKIATLKTSANQLLTTLSRSGNPNIRTSVVPFSEYVNVGRSNRNQRWLDNQAISGQWDGCVGSRNRRLRNVVELRGEAIPAVDGIQCTSELQPLTKNLNKARKTISDMTAVGWTYMPAGLMWGLRTLEPEAPFTEASRAQKNVTSVDRVLVLMSDGDNTVRVVNNGPLHKGEDNGSQADALTADICETVKDKNITVYTIAYEINSTSTRRLLENCASSSRNFFDARDASDLEEAFEQIGNELSSLRLNA